MYIMASLHPHLQNCDTCAAKSQGPRVKEQDPRTMQGTKDMQCMHGYRAMQGPRAEDQRARVTRTKNQ